MGRLFGRGVSLLTSIVLTRSLGASLYGIYAFTKLLLGLSQVVTRLGADKSLIRFLPEHRDDPPKQRALLKLSYVTSLITSTLVAALVFLLAPFVSSLTLTNPLFVEVLRVAALVLPFNTLASVTNAAFQGIERVEYKIGVANVVGPVSRLVFVGGAVVAGYAVVGAAAGLVVGSALTLCSAVYLLLTRTDLYAARSTGTFEPRQYFDFSLPLAFNQLGNFLYNRIDLLMIGFLLSESFVGIYNVAVVLTSVLVLPLNGFNQLFPSVASRLYHDGEYRELERIYTVVTRWALTLAMFPALFMAFNAREVLSVFGSDFTDGWVVLVLFVGAKLVNAAAGPSGLVLMMSDRQYLTLANQVGSGVLNAVLNYVLILEFGFVGAAVATTTTVALVNLVRVAEVWYLESLFPYTRASLKPLFAGAGAAVTMQFASSWLDGTALLFAGAMAGGAVFVAVLYGFGVEEDLRLLRRMVSGGDS